MKQSNDSIFSPKLCRIIGVAFGEGESWLGGPTVRCYFMWDGHIQDVQVLDGLSDAEAIKRAQKLLAERQASKSKSGGKPPDGFEIWKQERFIFRFP